MGFFASRRTQKINALQRTAVWLFRDAYYALHTDLLIGPRPMYEMVLYENPNGGLQYTNRHIQAVAKLNQQIHLICNFYIEHHLFDKRQLGQDIFFQLNTLLINAPDTLFLKPELGDLDHDIYNEHVTLPEYTSIESKCKSDGSELNPHQWPEFPIKTSSQIRQFVCMFLYGPDEIEYKCKSK